MGQLKCRYFRKHHIIQLFKHVVLGLTLSIKRSLLIVLIFTIKNIKLNVRLFLRFLKLICKKSHFCRNLKSPIFF